MSFFSNIKQFRNKPSLSESWSSELGECLCLAPENLVLNWDSVSLEEVEVDGASDWAARVEVEILEAEVGPLLDIADDLRGPLSKPRPGETYNTLRPLFLERSLPLCDLTIFIQRM